MCTVSRWFVDLLLSGFEEIWSLVMISFMVYRCMPGTPLAPVDNHAPVVTEYLMRDLVVIHSIIPTRFRIGNWGKLLYASFSNANSWYHSHSPIESLHWSRLNVCKLMMSSAVRLWNYHQHIPAYLQSLGHLGHLLLWFCSWFHDDYFNRPRLHNWVIPTDMVSSICHQSFGHQDPAIWNRLSMYGDSYYKASVVISSYLV